MSEIFANYFFKRYPLQVVCKCTLRWNSMMKNKNKETKQNKTGKKSKPKQNRKKKHNHNLFTWDRDSRLIFFFATPFSSWHINSKTLIMTAKGEKYILSNLFARNSIKNDSNVSNISIGLYCKKKEQYQIVFCFVHQCLAK